MIGHSTLLSKYVPFNILSTTLSPLVWRRLPLLRCLSLPISCVWPVVTGAEWAEIGMMDGSSSSQYL